MVTAVEVEFFTISGGSITCYFDKISSALDYIKNCDIVYDSFTLTVA